MNRRILGAIGGLTGLAALVAWAMAGPERSEPSDPDKRPRLALLTSLPLVFSESFGLEGGGSPALTNLEQHYQVQPIGVADTESLKGHRLLLMAHPRAQPSEVLVELDRWVRDGGKLVLLADPKLEWPSERPLGDRLRPPPAFADTGLLRHWGLKLIAPQKPGPVRLGGGHNPILYFSPGRLVSTNPDCLLSRADITAECPIGRGKVAIVADADFLNVEALGEYGIIPGNQTGELIELLESIQTH